MHSHFDSELAEAAVEVFPAGRHGAGVGMFFEAHADRVEVLHASSEDQPVEHLENLPELVVIGERREQHGDWVDAVGFAGARLQAVFAGGAEITIEANEGLVGHRIPLRDG